MRQFYEVLRGFGQEFNAVDSDQVTAYTTYIDSNGKDLTPAGSVFYLSNQGLTDHAISAGKTTWDENDIVALLVAQGVDVISRASYEASRTT